MDGSSFKDIEKLEADLWSAADNLRANSKLTSSDYFMPVLGIIFLRHAANRFDVATKQIADDKAAGRMPKRAVIDQDYVRRRSLPLPQEARYDWIMSQSSGGKESLPKLVTNAMKAIEEKFAPLKNVLPKDYGIFETKVLEDLMRVFDSEQIRQATGDVFGRIYEYFLAKFSIQKAHDNGEFFTPSSLVQMIVNVIEPNHGKVFDPACGSGGMFVQSSHFIEQTGGDTAKKVVFYGQEKNPDTIHIGLMNLAVHGLTGEIAEAITYYEDKHNLVGGADFVMANPPFNVDLVDAERIKTDTQRLPFGLPGVNKQKKVSNGNYLWISYFWSYLNKTGRAGFVMSSQASSAGHGEKEVRQKIVETGDVDAMMSIRSNFFYTRTVPCELWFFDKGKPTQRRDHVLMIDARNVYRKINRTINDFSPEQMANLSAIVWLYRGQEDRFRSLIRHYFEQCLQSTEPLSSQFSQFNLDFATIFEPLKMAIKRSKVSLDSIPVYAELSNQWDIIASESRRLVEANEQQRLKYQASSPESIKKIHAMASKLGATAELSKRSMKDVDLLFKLASQFVRECQSVGIELGNQVNARSLSKSLRDLDASRIVVIRQLKQVIYFHRQAAWLLDRFPNGVLVDVPGLVKLVSRSEIEASDWSLTPGRYVGVPPAEIDKDFDFEKTMRDIHVELADLNAEAVELAAKIQANYEDMGI